MVKGDLTGHTVETPREATQAENSSDSFNVLWTSLILALLFGIGPFWYFGIWPDSETLRHSLCLSDLVIR